MDNILIVFLNRNHTMQFASYLKRMNIKNRVVDTPRDLSISCGISIIFKFNDFDKVKHILKNSNFNSFSGFYRVFENGIFKKYYRI